MSKLVTLKIVVMMKVQNSETIFLWIHTYISAKKWNDMIKTQQESNFVICINYTKITKRLKIHLFVSCIYVHTKCKDTHIFTSKKLHAGSFTESLLVACNWAEITQCSNLLAMFGLIVLLDPKSKAKFVLRTFPRINQGIKLPQKTSKVILHKCCQENFFT